MRSLDSTLPLARAILFVFVMLLFLAHATNCAGPIKAVQGTVKIDPEHCKESVDHAGDPDVALLDCLSGEASVRVEFGRAEWHAIKARGKPSDAGSSPGK